MKKEDIHALLEKYAEDNCNNVEKAWLETWYLKEDHNYSEELTETEINQDLKEVLDSLPKQGIVKTSVRSNISVPFLAASSDEEGQKRVTFQ